MLFVSAMLRLPVVCTCSTLTAVLRPAIAVLASNIKRNAMLAMVSPDGGRQA
jgi:hypothetical protein